MSPFTRKGIDKAHATQRKKYGKDYSSEMARRAKLRKTHGTGATKKNYPNLSEEMARRAKVRWDARKTLEGSES